MTKGERKGALHKTPWHSHLSKTAQILRKTEEFIALFTRSNDLVSILTLLNSSALFLKIHFYRHLSSKLWSSGCRIFLHFSDYNILLSGTQFSYSLIIRAKLPYISPDPAVADLRIGLYAGSVSHLFMHTTHSIHFNLLDRVSEFYLVNSKNTRAPRYAVLFHIPFPSSVSFWLFPLALFLNQTPLTLLSDVIAQTKWLAIYWTIAIRTANKHKIFFFLNRTREAVGGPG